MDDPVETGLAGAVYAPAETLSHAELVTVTVNSAPSTASPMPAGWTIHKVAALVRDLAMNLYDLPVILQKNDLTAEQYVTLEANPFFKRALESATLEWNSPQSTNKRLAMEAAIALEDALPTVAARLSKANEPLPGVVALAQLFTKIAGIGENSQQGPAGEKFKITINLGADVFQQTKEVAPKVVSGLSLFPEGASQDTALQRLVATP